MIFKSRQVNLDPEPWVWADGDRAANGLDVEVAIYSPRPEFEPTRDPFPWESHGSDGDGGTTVMRFRTREHAERDSDRYGYLTQIIWAPRRDQFDTPVNRVLAAFRSGGWPNPSMRASAWLDFISPAGLAANPAATAHFKPEEIEHAGKVLTRLAGWSA